MHQETHQILLMLQNFVKKNIKFITLSGFKSNNKISKLGTINLWFNSKSFNIVEMLFSYVLLLIVDLIKGQFFILIRSN